DSALRNTIFLRGLMRIRPMFVVLGAVATLAGAVSARQAQAPANPQPPAPAAGQAPAARGGGRGPAIDDGPVRDDRNAIIGYTKLAPIPGTPWLIHDASRPHQPMVTPGAAPG